ncbi:MAG: hypothetical protein R6V58_00550 [Planctomycetota bacterium]
MGDDSPERRDRTREGLLARLHVAWRIKRLLIVEHNEVMPRIADRRERESYRHDWMRRDRENYDEINALLAETCRADHAGHRHTEPLPWSAEKRAAETDASRDAELLARPRLRRPGAGTVEVADPLEDFTTYTEQDPNNDVSVAEHTVSFTDLEVRDSDTYVYRDKGADHFDGFEHLLDFITTDHTTSPKVGIHFLWALSNVVEDARYWDLYSSQAVGTDWHATDGLKLWCPENDSLDQYDSVSLNTRYWLTVSRDAGGSTVVEYVYDDADRTNLLDSLSVSVPGSRKYRYVFALNTYNLGDSGITASGDVRNLDLGEAAGRPAPLLGPLAGRGQIAPTLAR